MKSTSDELVTKLVSVPDYARRMNMSDSSVYAKIRNGELHAIKQYGGMKLKIEVPKTSATELTNSPYSLEEIERWKADAAKFAQMKELLK